MAAASGKAVVEALICAALSDSDSDTDDDQWRHYSFLHLPPPTRATSDGAGQSGHGSSSWTFVDGADPRVAAVLADLDEADRRQEFDDAVRDERAAKKAAQQSQRAAVRLLKQRQPTVETRPGDDLDDKGHSSLSSGCEISDYKGPHGVEMRHFCCARCGLCAARWQLSRAVSSVPAADCSDGKHALRFVWTERKLYFPSLHSAPETHEMARDGSRFPCVPVPACRCNLWTEIAKERLGAAGPNRCPSARSLRERADGHRFCSVAPRGCLVISVRRFSRQRGGSQLRFGIAWCQL